MKSLLTTYVAVCCRLKCLNSYLPWVAWSLQRGLVLWLNQRTGKSLQTFRAFSKFLNPSYGRRCLGFRFERPIAATIVGVDCRCWLLDDINRS